MNTEIDRADRIAGAIYGMAFGDSWGYPTEFMSHSAIIGKSPKPPKILRITDDTQMSLYNLRAIQRILESETDLSNLANSVAQQDRIKKIFAEEHLHFSEDPDNNRAPGNTVMGALAIYGKSVRITGREGSSVNSSKGCGTVMRSPWIGLLDLPRETIILLAILQSETTHGHPNATISAAIAALIVREISRTDLHSNSLDSRARVGSMFYSVAALAAEVGNLKSNLVASPRFQVEIDEFRAKTFSLNRSLSSITDSELRDGEMDICSWFGQGWVADEALFCAAAVFAIYGTDSYGGIKRLVYSDGDSDSIAAIGGAFLGALNGFIGLFSQANSRGTDIQGSLEARYRAELSEALDYLKDN